MPTSQRPRATFRRVTSCTRDEKRDLFSWIILRPMKLSGIMAWHWSYSRPSLIDIWSATLSTLSQTTASSLKLAMGNAVASDVWRTECFKGQRLHLCCLTSISVPSRHRVHPIWLCWWPGPPVFPQVLEWDGRGPFFGYAKNCWLPICMEAQAEHCQNYMHWFHLNTRESSRKLGGHRQRYHHPLQPNSNLTWSHAWPPTHLQATLGRPLWQSQSP